MARWQRLWSKYSRLATGLPCGVWQPRPGRTDARRPCAGDHPGGTDKHVREAMRRDFQVVDSHDMLDQAVQVVQRCGCRALPVEHSGELVGMLTLESVGSS